MTPHRVLSRPPIGSIGRHRPRDLCQLAGRWRPRDLGAGAMAEEKRDGFRCLYMPGVEDKPALWTRNGMPMPGVGHILARLLEVEQALGAPHFIDGELVVSGSLAATKAHYERGWKAGDAGTFYAFDCVPLDDWRAGRCDTPLYERKSALQRAIEATAPDRGNWEWREGSRSKDHGIDPLSLIPDEWVSSPSDVDQLAQRIWAAGGEGVMVKDAESPYVRARSDSWLKVKRSGVS